MNTKIFTLIQKNLQSAFNLPKYQKIVIDADTLVDQLPWTPARYTKFKDAVEAELSLPCDYKGTLRDIVDDLSERYILRFFSEIWKPRTGDYEHTGWELADELNRLNPVSVLDVGCGGGLPSVVFAIACPQWRVTAIDAVAKKTAFVQTAAHALKLTNLNVIHGRVEELSQTFDLVTCRAFAELADFTRWTAASLNPSGRWLAMKGKYPQAEIERLPKEALIEKVQTLSVPGLDADRCLVWLSPNR